MIKFRSWLIEAKRKKNKSEPQTPIVVSSPIRGPNQDQSGFGVTRAVADYTISDEKKHLK